jgi:hypothetical protein
MIGTRVQYSQLYQTAAQRAAFSNTFSALSHILKTDGFLGLYYGAVPGLICWIFFQIQFFVMKNIKNLNFIE